VERAALVAEALLARAQRAEVRGGLRDDIVAELQRPGRPLAIELDRVACARAACGQRSERQAHTFMTMRPRGAPSAVISKKTLAILVSEDRRGRAAGWGVGRVPAKQAATYFNRKSRIKMVYT
jgi:hypothetical protein